jgi:hypothetical protein
MVRILALKIEDIKTVAKPELENIKIITELEEVALSDKVKLIVIILEIMLDGIISLMKVRAVPLITKIVRPED